MKKYLLTLLEEKNIDLDLILEVEGQSGTNYIPMQILVKTILNAPKNEQNGIRDMLVRIDFFNGNVLDYFKHLAQAIAF